jgi:hypothetical protein
MTLCVRPEQRSRILGEGPGTGKVVNSAERPHGSLDAGAERATGIRPGNDRETRAAAGGAAFHVTFLLATIIREEEGTSPPVPGSSDRREGNFQARVPSWSPCTIRARRRTPLDGQESCYFIYPSHGGARPAGVPRRHVQADPAEPALAFLEASTMCMAA